MIEVCGNYSIPIFDCARKGGSELGDSRTVFALEALDMFLGNALRTDVPVDGARSHRDRRHVTRNAPVINRNVGHASADIHDGHLST